jgi:hypothetical protein
MAHRQTSSIKVTVQNDTEFRAFVQFVHDALAASGLVQTADTGQINIGTVTKPVAANTVAGYEIWRFDDAHQATSPIFIKVEYGTGNAATNPGFWIQVGKAMNGSGGFTGVTSTRTQLSTASTEPTNPLTLTSGDVDRFLIAWCFSQAVAGINLNRTCMWSIERERNALGNTIAGGALLTYYAPTSSIKHTEFFDPTVGTLGQELELGILGPRVGSGTLGADVGIFPCYHGFHAFKPSGMNFMGYFHASMAANQQVTIPVYGADRTYYTLGDTFMGRTGLSASWAVRGSDTNLIPISLLVRYDP